MAQWSRRLMLEFRTSAPGCWHLPLIDTSEQEATHGKKDRDFDSTILQGTRATDNPTREVWRVAGEASPTRSEILSATRSRSTSNWCSPRWRASVSLPPASMPKVGVSLIMVPGSLMQVEKMKPPKIVEGPSSACAKRRRSAW